MARSPTRSDAPTATQLTWRLDIRSLIDSACTLVAARVNAEITALYWRVGRHP
jgi:predicted secreted Zn-dependent protease